MPIKSILCLFNGDLRDVPVITVGLALSLSCQATLRILHIAEPPLLAEETTSGGIYRISAELGRDAAGILEKDARELNEAAESFAREQARKAGVKLCLEGETDQGNGVQFRTRVGTAEECLDNEGRPFDLIIVGLENQANAHREVVEAALFKTGAPVLLIPWRNDSHLLGSGFAKTVVIGWDGSLAAGNALRASIPHLQQAKDVYLVIVEERGRYPSQRQESDVLRYLASHGVAAERLHMPGNGRPVGEVLQAKASDLGASLIVMGAFGNSRLSERLFGGVTRYLLDHAGLPLLLSH